MILTNIRFPNMAAWLLAVGFSLLTVAPAYSVQSVTYYHWDALGSPVAATDEQGNVKWREEYQPYGEKIQNQPQSQTNTRWYTGHPHDNATGLTYMGARWYDPVVGRFMGNDPKGFSEGDIYSFNRYAYANNNPYINVDPDGREVLKILFTNSYFYIGRGGIGFTTTDSLNSRYPRLSELTPTLQEKTQRILFEHEGRGNQPMIPRLGGERTPEQQRELVNPTTSGQQPTSWTLDSKHVVSDENPKSRAVDIVDRRYLWDRTSPAGRSWWQEHGEIVENEGLAWGGRWAPLDSGGLGKDLPHAELK